MFTVHLTRPFLGSEFPEMFEKDDDAKCQRKENNITPEIYGEIREEWKEYQSLCKVPGIALS